MSCSILAARCLVCLAPAALAGCYTYSSVASEPAPGTLVALDLTDACRVQLAGRIGSEVLRIEGWLVSAADSQVTVRVERTVGIRGNTVPWAGELTGVPASCVASERVKRFSATRTVVLAGGLTAGFVAFLAGRGLIGGAQSTEGGRPPDQGGSQ